MNVLRYLNRRGIRVPEDVQIIGFDGLRTIFDDSPYCSTIVQPVEALAETAVNILLTENRSQLSPLTSLPVSSLPGGTTRDVE